MTFNLLSLTKTLSTASVLLGALFVASCDSSSVGSKASISKSAGEQMQRYCVELFPDEASMQERLMSDGFRPDSAKIMWAKSGSDIVGVKVMESPTGRGFGCGLNFISDEPISTVRDSIIQTVDTGGRGVFSTTMVDINDPLSGNFIINGPTLATDAKLESLENIPIKRYVMLYTEK